MRVTLLTESMGGNSLGRTYCLWLMARRLGWEVQVLTTIGNEVWLPLRGTEFASEVTRVSPEDLTDTVRDSTLLIACKPLPGSLGLALKVAKKLRMPLLIDVDDPDLQIRTRNGQPFLAALRWARRPLRSLRDLRSARACRTYPTTVSNPWLWNIYGGDLVPHVRPVLEEGAVSTGDALSIVFVGTNHAHKGVDVLRSAASTLRSEGKAVTLTITDHPPEDAAAWEQWIGSTTLEEGLRLAAAADVIVIPSLRVRHAEGQLPVKLIDAMMLGRTVVVSDVPPLPWAIGDAGLVVPPGDVDALVAALREVEDDALRARLGHAARERAVELFSIDAVAPVFERACHNAVRGGT